MSIGIGIDTTTLDIQRASEVLEFIKAHPDLHNQAHFAAKTPFRTTSCIAGHTLILSGQYRLGEHHVFGEIDFVRIADDRIVVASEEAQRLLGLSDADTSTLFFNLQLEAEALDYLELLIANARAEQ